MSAKSRLAANWEERAQAPGPAGEPQPALIDVRFRQIVGEEGWENLPPPVRRRFSIRHQPGEMVLYRGRVEQTSLSHWGRIFALLTTVIGSPLPRRDGATGDATVIVTEDASSGDQSWIRMYASDTGAPQVIRSMKRFRGTTGLEEYVGGGIGMALRVYVENGALHFASDHYFLELRHLRVTLPKILEPGRMLIVHREEAGGEFSFELTLIHPLLGGLVHQLAHFSEVSH